MKKIFQNRNGFTLTEILVAVAIIVVLAAVAITGVVSATRSISQKELDSKAEIIYFAAQDALAQLRAGGYEDSYAVSEERGIYPLTVKPYGLAEEMPLCYILSDGGVVSAAAADILPEGGVDAEVRGRNWVVEFNPQSGSAYAVFYWEDDTTEYEPERFNALRVDSERRKTPGKVGYYGGDAVKIVKTRSLAPWITVENGETLSVTFHCGRVDDKAVSFDISISDGVNTYVKTVGSSLASGLDNIKAVGSGYEYTMVLDELTEGRRFGELGLGLTPGAVLEFNVTAHSENLLVADGTAEPKRANSLFADAQSAAPEGTALLRCGRHLQNLDSASSGLAVDYKAAVLCNSLDFSADASGSGTWYDTYGDLAFSPIDNHALLRFDGGGNAIYGLNAVGSGDAGLFGCFYGTDIRGLQLVAAHVEGGGATGAIAGRTTGALTVENCRVYLRTGDLAGHTLTDLPYRLHGKTAVGGLIGAAKEGPVSVSGSFAAMIATTGTKYTGTAGGLIGSVGCPVSIENSYADCYLTADVCGGLTGESVGAPAITLENCYAAGYLITEGKAAGLTAGPLASAKSCYTAVNYPETPKYLFSTAPSIVSSGETQCLYYMSTGLNSSAKHLNCSSALSYEELAVKGKTQASVTSLLGDGFCPAAAATTAYNLQQQGLTVYSYPALSGLPHYGDWQAEFETGALVYFEQYADRTYGFFGANVQGAPLYDSRTVVGDGYALLYKASVPETVPSVVYLSGPAGTETTWTPTPAEADFRMAAVGADTYYLLPLPAAAVNTAYAPSAFYQPLRIGDETVWYNPHFAKMIGGYGAVAPTLSDAAAISVRSPRNLRALSLYYKDYAEATEKCIFRQETDLRYDEYEWERFGGIASGTQQTPIGTGSVPFSAYYAADGHLVSGVSIEPGEDRYLGLFGRSTGTVSGLAFVSEYLPDTGSACFIGAPGDSYYLLADGTAYIGAIVGKNEGTVTNCAAAGYTMSVSAYRGTRLYVGGLTGSNSGVVTSCAADLPKIAVSGTFANAYIGGFAGSNSGMITNSYAIGSIDATLRSNNLIPAGSDSTMAATSIAGFAAVNGGGIIRSCYCATALVTSGAARVNGFASGDGNVQQCSYLNGGSYAFAGAIRSYNTNDESAAAAKSYQELCSVSLSDSDRADETLYHDSTHGTDYPFPEVVRFPNGIRVHYGDWPAEATLGTLGVFYWEHEEGGNNPGYHFSYIEMQEGTYGSGSTLCRAHDDGGVITEFGYGFYVQSGGESKLSYQWSDTLKTALGSDVGTATDIPDGSCNRAASDEIGRQMPGYRFYAFTTRVADSGDYLYLLDEPGKNKPYDVRDGKLTLWFGENSYVYTISPFFADAMSLDSLSAGSGSRATERPKPGTKAHPYAIRTAAQLQYINWNSALKSVSADITKDTSKQFPYLQYATVTDTGKQSRTAAEEKRPAQYWEQTHDLNADGIGEFHPIAGATTNSPKPGSNTSYKVILYGWFGGSYDGQSYYIKNLSVNSGCYSVGLFGTTAGAEIQNVILYGDNENAAIRRSTTASSNCCAYAIGGLVGIAYDYADHLGQGEITNCAIAGYRIVDESKNQLDPGEANVGGLIGVANVNLNRCSAVTDIEIACTHRNADGSMNSAVYGNFIRVGGMVGGVRYKVSDCYTGGSITVGDETLKEIVKSDGSAFADPTQMVMVQSGKDTTGGDATYVFLGGIGGSGFSSTFSNFCNSTGSSEGEPEYENCYTYIRFPKMERNIYAISMIGSLADRYGRAASDGAKLTIKNCYYLQSSAELDYDLPKYYIRKKKPISEALANPDTVELMLQGNLDYVKNVLWDSGKPSYVSLDCIPVSYSGLQGLISGLNGSRSGEEAPWNAVTTVELATGMPVSGKHSHPGAATELNGLDYPFPAVITQKDYFTGENVKVHYGEWAKMGLYWQHGLSSMDMLAEYDPEAGAATQEYSLIYCGVAPAAGGLSFSYGSGRTAASEIAEVITEGENAPRFDPETGRWSVHIRALCEGSVDICATDAAGICAVMTLEVTAQMHINADKPELAPLLGASDVPPDTTALHVTDAKGREIAVEWDPPAAENEALVGCSITPAAGETPAILSAAGLQPGETLLRLSCRFVYRKEVRSGETVTQSGVVFPASAVVPVRVEMKSVVGLRGGAGGDAVYNECDTIASGSAAGKNVSYSNAACTPHLEGSSLYLYGVDDAAPIRREDIAKIIVRSGEVPHMIFGETAEPEYTAVTASVGEMLLPENSSHRFVPIRIAADNAEALDVTVVLRRTTENGTAEYTLCASVIPQTEFLVEYCDGDTLYERRTVSRTAPHITLCAAPEKEDCKFLCWTDGTAQYMPGQDLKVTQDLQLTPVWQKLKHTVSFDPGYPGAPAIASQRVDDGATPDPALWPAAPVRSGYRFLGWSCAGSTYTQPYSEAVTDDLRFVALWGSYGVRLELAGGSLPVGTPSMLTAALGDTVILPTPKKERWCFVGWTDGETTYTTLYTVTGDAKLTALWRGYTVTLDPDGGALPDGAKPEYKAPLGTVIALPAPVKTGWRFAGWSDGETICAADYPVAGDASLTARWERPVVTVKAYPEGSISFSAEGGVPAGTTVTAVPADGYTLYKLYIKGHPEQELDSSFTVGEEDVELVAVGICGSFGVVLRTILPSTYSFSYYKDGAYIRDQKSNQPPFDLGNLSSLQYYFIIDADAALWQVKNYATGSALIPITWYKPAPKSQIQEASGNNMGGDDRIEFIYTPGDGQSYSFTVYQPKKP